MRELYIWGTGYRARQILRDHSDVVLKCNIRGFIDNYNTEKKFECWDVFRPTVLSEQRDVDIYIAVDDSLPIVNQIISDYPFYKDRILDIRHFEKLKMITRYKGSEDPEIREILDFLETEPLACFNYPYVKKYDISNITIFKDDISGLFYFMHLGKKVFLSRNYSDEYKSKAYVRSLFIEQDEQSPHRYLSESFDVPHDSVVIDAGCAEGLFSISIIEHVKHIYIFEPDSLWCEALKLTFEPFKDKVTIIEKAVSNYTYGHTTTIDSEIEDANIDFIKMDIEGEEFYALLGAEQTLKRSTSIKCVVCTYHQEFAYAAICDYLNRAGFVTEHSEGYMWFNERYNDMRAFVLRRGLIRASK